MNWTELRRCTIYANEEANKENNVVRDMFQLAVKHRRFSKPVLHGLVSSVSWGTVAASSICHVDDFHRFGVTVATTGLKSSQIILVNSVTNRYRMCGISPGKYCHFFQ